MPIVSSQSKPTPKVPVPSFDRLEMPVAIWRLAISGRTRFRFHQYGAAQEMFASALSLNPPLAVRSVLASCYVTSGYLALMHSAREAEAVQFTEDMLRTYGPRNSDKFADMLRFLRGD